MTTTTPLPPLTDAQSRVLRYVSDYCVQHGYGPTVREVCLAFAFKSTEGAMAHLRPLRRKGYVSWVEGKARTLQPVEVQA